MIFPTYLYSIAILKGKDEFLVMLSGTVSENMIVHF